MSLLQSHREAHVPPPPPTPPTEPCLGPLQGAVGGLKGASQIPTSLLAHPVISARKGKSLVNLPVPRPPLGFRRFGVNPSVQHKLLQGGA